MQILRIRLEEVLRLLRMLPRNVVERRRRNVVCFALTDEREVFEQIGDFALGAPGFVF
jgi:hypothetical protein